MAGIRKDYLTDDYVIIATERAKRPQEFKDKAKKKEVKPEEALKCPFCPGHEHMIPGVVEEEIGKDGRFLVRSIPNKFRAVSEEGNTDLRTDNEFYTYADAVGNHQVIIETPNHGEELHELSEEHIVKVIKMYVRRLDADIKNGHRYPALFKNKGGDGGASLSHSHAQLISYNLLPERIAKIGKEAKNYHANNNCCAYCRVIDKELNSERHISLDDHFFVLTPYASRFAMQLMIIPLRHINNMLSLNKEEIVSLAKNIKKYLGKLEELGSPSYNVLFYNFYDGEEHNHFFIEVSPRLAKWAGFELLTNTIINSVPPEEAAKYYKE
ncbi:galactose-1-phosphate uridylyltransferase [Candidatus Woesearchaeota archaeon]|nr:galactose-1-phosphate uridylyltransferase [Candidatus Woesearchaeota archaeon]